MRGFCFLIVLLALASLPLSQSLGSQAIGALNSSIRAGPLAGKIASDLNGMTLTKENAASRVLLVKGAGITRAEWAVVEAAKAQYPFLKYASTAPDSGETLNKIETGGYSVIVLIGGPSQNNLVFNLNAKNAFNETGEVYNYFVAQYGKTKSGTVLLVLSDKRGFDNAKLESVKYSPLLFFLPPEYVPAAATGISVILLALLNLFKSATESKITEHGKKGRCVDATKKAGFFCISKNEAQAFLIASLVLGISISWQYLGPTPGFFFWVFVNACICIFTSALHQGASRLFAHFYKIKMEYKLWREGAAMTLVSSFLGNAFSVQGFLLSEAPKGLERWKAGLMSLSGPVFVITLALLFAVFNFFEPSRLAQSIYTSCAIGGMASMLPIRGLNGGDIKSWNKWIWLVSFVLIGAGYVFVTFIL